MMFHIATNSSLIAVAIALGVGTAAAEDSARWSTQAAGGVRKVLSAVTLLNL
jgi:hypothetical protein